MQKLGKFNLKINVLPNGLEKYMRFTIDNKLCFIDSFQFVSSSLDSLVKNFNKDEFKYFFFFFLFLSEFSFTNIHDSQDSRRKGRLFL